MQKSIILFICLAVLAYAGIASAQVTGGLKAGVNFANMSFASSGGSPNPGNRTTWMAGGFVDFPVAKNIFIQPEALITLKGATTPQGTDVATLKLTYLDVPVLLRVDVPTSGRVVPYLYAGPNVGFLLSAKSTATLSGTLQEVDIKSDMKSTEFGMTLGGGVSFGKVFVETRYVWGLTNAIKPTALEEGATAKNRVFKIIGGIRF